MFITTVGGGTGFIGKSVTSLLRNKGHEITVISRTSGNGKITWDELSKTQQLPECDAVINLSGEKLMNPLKRFNEDFKNKLIESRISKNKLLTSLIEKCSQPPKVWVSASAIGRYPTTGSFDENSDIQPPYSWIQSFSQDIESSSILKPSVPTRRAVVRIGLVLGLDGGILEQSLLPFKLGLGGCLGSGNQWFPWIHIDDMSGILCHILEKDNVKGVLNGVAPESVTNAEYTTCMATVLNRPAFFHVPEFVFRTMLHQELADIILGGSKVIPKRTLESGYLYKFPQLKEALVDLTSK